MDSIIIRQYKPEDYDEVNRLFLSHFNDYIKNGIIGGMKTLKVFGSLILLLFLGSVTVSFYHGLFACFVGIIIHAISVCLCYGMYLW